MADALLIRARHARLERDGRGGSALEAAAVAEGATDRARALIDRRLPSGIARAGSRAQWGSVNDAR